MHVPGQMESRVFLYKFTSISAGTNNDAALASKKKNRQRQKKRNKRSVGESEKEKKKADTETSKKNGHCHLVLSVLEIEDLCFQIFFFAEVLELHRETACVLVGETTRGESCSATVVEVFWPYNIASCDHTWNNNHNNNHHNITRRRRRRRRRRRQRKKTPKIQSVLIMTKLHLRRRFA